MVRDDEGEPILNHVRFLFENIEARGSMVGEVSDLNEQAGGISHDLKVIRFYSHGILKAFGCFIEIFLLFVDGGAGMPAEHASHFAFDESHFGDF